MPPAFCLRYPRTRIDSLYRSHAAWEGGAACPVEGKVVVVTGGAMGIGRWLARTFAKEGARLAIADVAPMDNVLSGGAGARRRGHRRPHQRLRRGRGALAHGTRSTGATGASTCSSTTQPSSRTSTSGAPRWPRIRDMDEAFFDKVMRTNLGGTFLCTKHVLPYMESLNAGHIIHFGQGTLKRAAERGAQHRHVRLRRLEALDPGVRQVRRRGGARVQPSACSAWGRAAAAATSESRETGAGIPGGGGGIVTEDSPQVGAREPAPRAGGVGRRPLRDRGASGHGVLRPPGHRPRRRPRHRGGLSIRHSSGSWNPPSRSAPPALVFGYAMTR